MAFCPQCGAQVQGAFCMRCGASIGAAPQQPAQQPPQNPQPQQPYAQPQYPQQPPQQQQQQWGQPQQGYPQQQQQWGQPAPAAPAGGLDENVACALCYALGVLSGVAFLVIEPFNKNKTIRFHAFQSIFFALGYFVFWIIFSVFTGILRSLLNYTLWFIPSLLSLAVGLAFFGVWLLLMYKAYNKERFKIPIIGDLAEKQA